MNPSGSFYNAFIYMLLYFIAFVRPQPIAVRRGERPERGRQPISIMYYLIGVKGTKMWRWTRVLLATIIRL